MYYLYAMKKIFILNLLLTLGLNAFSQNKTMKTLYDFKAKTIDGADFDFSSLKGKKVLIVNTASECGNTPQYKDLEALYKKFGGDKFTVIGFPSNDFGAQEPGSNEEIKAFCTKNYGVSFLMMSKIKVKGEDMHPLYKWLTRKDQNGAQDAEVKWNFQKFLVDENGFWAGVVSDEENPMCERILDWIQW
jgi:glutathione peroxidase